MAGLKVIKSKIKSIEKSRQVTRAMEAVSAAKMRKSQHKAFGGRAYARASASVLARVAGARELLAHPLVQPHPEATKTLYLVITSDKGLAGALNSAVLRAAWADALDKETAVIAIGRKAHEFFERRGVAIEAFYPNTDDISPEVISKTVNAAAGQFASGALREVKIVYQNFISTFEQRPTLRTLFPLSLEELQKVVADIVPTKGAFAERGGVSRTPSYTIEPSEREVLGVIVPKLAGIFVYHALLESQASEHSARMVAMKSASDKAEELKGSLTLTFNKARQALITREVSEIIGGMETLS